MPQREQATKLTFDLDEVLDTLKQAHTEIGGNTTIKVIIREGEGPWASKTEGGKFLTPYIEVQWADLSL